MNERPNHAEGPATLAQGLLATLQEEHTALEGLCAAFDQQLDALRERRQDTLEQAIQSANEAVTRLGTLQQTRQRKMRLLGRVLGVEPDGSALPQLAAALDRQQDRQPEGEALAQRLLTVRRQIRERAVRTQQRCDELAFTLQYVADLSREMMRTLQGLDAPPPTRIYTAAGDASQTAPPSSFLNKLG